MCPDLGKENMIFISGQAYQMLKKDTELQVKMRENAQLTRSIRNGAKSTLEGGDTQRGGYPDFKSMQGSKLRPLRERNPALSEIRRNPKIMYPPESERTSINKGESQ